jgi:uncharacterized membrane protein
MADLIAIGYDDETTAAAAAEEVKQLALVPVFGIAVGMGIGTLMGKVEKSGIDKEFQQQVRDMVRPGASALFLVIEKVTPGKAIEGLSRFGGTVLKSSLSKDAEREVQDALHGTASVA